MSLQPAIGSTSCKTRECLIRCDGAPDRAAVRARMSFPNGCSLSFREEHQTRNDDSQRGCDLSDRGWVHEHWAELVRNGYQYPTARGPAQRRKAI